MFIFRYTKIGLAMRATAKMSRSPAAWASKPPWCTRWSGSSPVSWALWWDSPGRRLRCIPPLAEVGLKALAVVILGGLDSVGGAIVAGVILGILENWARGISTP
jgi:branched-chain amino acid transport system permease protein